jgi:CheY-like chemotaxis protein
MASRSHFVGLVGQSNIQYFLIAIRNTYICRWGTDLADRLLSHTGMRVAIIEDQLNVRESLRILIDGTTGLRSAGTYRSMEEALQGVALEIPDVILVDLNLPGGMSGIEGIRELKKRYPAVVPVVLTIYEDNAELYVCSSHRNCR